jgi:hypothetical protein
MAANWEPAGAARDLAAADGCCQCPDGARWLEGGTVESGSCVNKAPALRGLLEPALSLTSSHHLGLWDRTALTELVQGYLTTLFSRLVTFVFFFWWC